MTKTLLAILMLVVSAGLSAHAQSGECREFEGAPSHCSTDDGSEAITCATDCDKTASQVDRKFNSAGPKPLLTAIERRVSQELREGAKPATPSGGSSEPSDR